MTDRFDPKSIETFVFHSWAWDAAAATLTLRYDLDDAFRFAETIVFAGANPEWTQDAEEALAPLFDLIHWVAGVSYFKAAVPPSIQFATRKPSLPIAAFLRNVYLHGLGEFAFENDLDLEGRLEFPAEEKSFASPGITGRADAGAVVPIGGGKDSLVSVEALRASEVEARAIVVGSSPLIQQVIETTGLDAISIKRSLDPGLFALNAIGAYNGHVPISAILATIMVTGGYLYGYDAILMSNESSASAANLVNKQGREVNHQYSKSLAFEREFAAILKDEIGCNVRYFSLLRPLSELAIASRFAQSMRYDHVFSSCNGNFAINKARPTDRWCRQCPKCRFVFLALAPFMDKARLINIFGANLLDDAAQLEGYEALCGLAGFKPFECVGEVPESRSALSALFAKAEWQDDYVISKLGHRCEGALPLADWLGCAQEHCVPSDYEAVLREIC